MSQPTKRALTDTELLEYAQGSLSPLPAARVFGLLMFHGADRTRLNRLQAASASFASVMGGTTKRPSHLPTLTAILLASLLVGVGSQVWIAQQSVPAPASASSAKESCASCHGDNIPNSSKSSTFKHIMLPKKGSKP